MKQDIIKKVSKEIGTSKPNDTIRITQTFRKEFLTLTDNSDNLLDIPITSIRLIFKIISDLKFYQFSPKNDVQMRLFDDEFKTENNTYARMKFKTTDISPNNPKNQASIKKGLSFLVNYKAGWYKSTNEKGKEISVYGGLINEPAISDGEISFLVSSYWMEKILKIEYHNESFYKIAWALTSSKQMLFFLWLLELKPEGTAMNYVTINKRFNLNYNSARDVAREFFKPMKKAFDANGNRSFNYAVRGNRLALVPYDMTGVLLDIKKETVDSQVVKQKTAYLKRKHNLTDSEKLILRQAFKVPNQFDLIEIAYKEVVKDFRGSDKKVTDLRGKELLERMQAKINDLYPVYRLSNDLPKCPKLI